MNDIKLGVLGGNLWGSSGSGTACVHGYSSATFFEYRNKPGIIPSPTYMNF